MRRACKIKRRGHWDVAEKVGFITLPYHDRHRRRLRMVDDGGLDFLLDLDHATYLDHGDGLILEEGGVIEIVAAREDVIKVSCASSNDLAKVAWHLGNRHTSVEIIDANSLHMLEDHVLMAMVEHQGARAEKTIARFSPEYGAYHSHHAHEDKS